MEEFAMHEAVMDGDLERVKQLIKGGFSVDSRDHQERTPLLRAVELAKRGRYEMVELLISSKCDLNLKDCQGRTPVLLAADAKKKDVVEILLQRGAQVICADNDEWSLLHRASYMGWADIVQRILDSGEADVNATDIGKETPLMWAARGGHEDVARLLIRAGANVHQRSAEERTALHWAAAMGLTEVVQVLLEQEGLDLNSQDKNGETPLHFSCPWQHHRDSRQQGGILKQLLVAGASTALKNNDSKTALSVFIEEVIECWFGDLPLDEIRLLVQHGGFFEDCDYARISQNPFLKEKVLNDVDLCTQSIVNKFHCQTLPALYSNPYFAKKIPSIEKFELSTRQIDDVKNYVNQDIQANMFCNVSKAQPTALSALCIQSLVAYQSGTKRPASSNFGESESPLKKTRSN